MSIPSGTLKFTSDSLTNSSIEWGATDLAWFSPSSDLGDWVSGARVDPPPPSPITSSQLPDWLGVAGVDPTPPPPITGPQQFDWVSGARVDPPPPSPITGSAFPDWLGGAGNNANNAFSSSSMLNAWHEAANVTLVQAVSGSNIYFQY